EEDLAADIQFLSRLWSQIQGRFEAARAPSVLHEEMDLTFRVVRDLFSPEVEEFLVDTRQAFDKCVEFASSLVPQLASRVKLWDLGGIIIIDFIDMERPEHRDRVFKALTGVLALDKARTNVLQISELGLVEMTRKRVRQSLPSLFWAPCPTCKGSGAVKSDAT